MSSRSSSKKASPSTTVMSVFGNALAWCSAHRYAALGLGLGVLVLGVAVVMNAPTKSSADVEDEDAEFSEFDPIDDAPLYASDLAPRVANPKTVPVRSHAQPAFEDLTPLFAPMTSTDSGVIAATFEGRPQPASVAPVWLAGTIETDDDMPSIEIPSSFAAPVQQATGPFLAPQ
jgi:hypothetical protein